MLFNSFTTILALIASAQYVAAMPIPAPNFGDALEARMELQARRIVLHSWPMKFTSHEKRD
ncbi:hypothetical protein EUX98_g7245 [Antrodiella citrinella]|uniref:Uncharacterized protein n=1 Tax=Antrodiella citrinella TaxID=2447956 RepID=A0A4S4MUD1_9APHY|nr:hypothetical protein EUX98_g7245 [Antrodiella citrinella]